MSTFAKVIAISNGDQTPQQFVLSLGESLVVGRSPASDVQVKCQACSWHHAQLFVEIAQESLGADAHPRLDLFILDESSRGTGITHDPAGPETVLKRGVPEKLGQHTLLYVPLNTKALESSVELKVQVLGDRLPDPYDFRKKSGRWIYGGMLGAGGLGIVYRAIDASGQLGLSGHQADGNHVREVAIKVSKLQHNSKVSARLRHAYTLHREAQWSMQKIHNPSLPNYCPRRSALFVRYLEDHTSITGWTSQAGSIDMECCIYEDAKFSWLQAKRAEEGLPDLPYIVMELVPGRNVHACMGFSRLQVSQPLLDRHCKNAIFDQALEALVYLESFGLIHRDFRTTNMMWLPSSSGIGGELRIIDLGLMIQAKETHVLNPSPVVKCNWKESQTKTFDWAPGEVKANGSVNFALPAHSFDIFSLAVLALQLESESLVAARQSVESMALGVQHGEVLRQALKLDHPMLERMLGAALQRPSPSEVWKVLQAAQEHGNNNTNKRILSSELRNTSHSRHHRSRSRSRSRTGGCNETPRSASASKVREASNRSTTFPGLLWRGGHPTHAGNARTGNGFLGFNEIDAHGVDCKEMLMALQVGDPFDFEVDYNRYEGSVTLAPGITSFGEIYFKTSAKYPDRLAGSFSVQAHAISYLSERVCMQRALDISSDKHSDNSKRPHIYSTLWESVGQTASAVEVSPSVFWWHGGRPALAGNARTGNGFVGFNEKDAKGADCNAILMQLRIGDRFAFEVDSVTYDGEVTTAPAMTTSREIYFKTSASYPDGLSGMFRMAGNAARRFPEMDSSNVVTPTARAKS
eukprot:TRINITY_DN7216_c0_g2_i1.p1 TRINITY_DN7216_c0_g2~~TRINITY_DN7216_c0_g2_i1.p1  ORF type:complete len:807 (+),score=101.34 TRINITY_DN7216_c0_g2_i1:36-2456(+)